MYSRKKKEISILIDLIFYIRILYILKYLQIYFYVYNFEFLDHVKL